MNVPPNSFFRVVHDLAISRVSIYFFFAPSLHVVLFHSRVCSPLCNYAVSGYSPRFHFRLGYRLHLRFLLYSSYYFT